MDTVLYFEGEKRQHHRIVRAVKNRFGAVSELGVFEMTGAGLQPRWPTRRRSSWPNGSRARRARRWWPRWKARGRCWSRCRRWSRPRRSARRGACRSGVDPNRTSLLLAVLEKRVGLELLADDVFVSVAGGLGGRTSRRPTSGVAAAVASSFRNRPLPARHGRVRRGRAWRARCARSASRACACARRPRWASRAACCRRATLPLDGRGHRAGRRLTLEEAPWSVCSRARPRFTDFRVPRAPVYDRPSGRALILPHCRTRGLHPRPGSGGSAYVAHPLQGLRRGPARPRRIRLRPFPDEPWLGLVLGLGTAARPDRASSTRCAVRCPATTWWARSSGASPASSARAWSGAPWTGLDIMGEHFVHVLLVVFLAYMGIVIGGQKGEWFEPARIIAAFRDSARPRTSTRCSTPP